MAFVKVKVDALEQQKKEYEKAIKSLDGALEQIKKVNASLGTDAMLEGVRTSLTKLAVSLETRQIRYRKQVAAPFVNGEQRERITARLKTRLHTDEKAQVECRLRFYGQEGGEPLFSANGICRCSEGGYGIRAEICIGAEA